jgi:HAD superfamily hydrolase (TIGR01484 family)
MSELPRLIAFDLDDTLAPSKSRMDDSMVPVLRGLLERADVCIISGGQIDQFRAQVLNALVTFSPALLRKLHLMPTCGTQYWRFEGGQWSLQYSETLTLTEREDTISALKEAALSLGLWETNTWGPVIEDRGSQVTFSALGQDAPLDAKKAWDPTGAKKNAMRARVAELIPALEPRSGGSTSIDVTRKGIDKAYGIRRLAELTGIPIDDMLFVGDRLDPEGNDFPVKSTGIETHAVNDWTDTRDYLLELLRNDF